MTVSFNQLSAHHMDTLLHVDTCKNDSWDLSASFYSTAGFSMDADTKRYVRHLKIGRTSMISGRLLTSVSQNFDVLSIFLRR